MDRKLPPQESSRPGKTRSAHPRQHLYLFTTTVAFALLLLAYCSYPSIIVEAPQALPPPPEQHHCDPNEPVKRVAVIGAGSAGSSAAYYLSKFSHPCTRINITIYERSSYIGGRSTTVNVFDSASEPVELGASIFVEVNRNLVGAVKAFGLSTKGFMSGEEEYAHDLGIYDGRDWVYVQNNDDSYWWNAAKLFWRYGTAPIRTRNLMKTTTEKFFKMYDAPYFPFQDVSQVVYDVNLTDVTAVSGEEFLKQNSIGEKFARELIQASTRVNYAQNLDQIHGLETMVCMATDGAMSVEGGNWRIFANMVIASKAEVKLETSVTGVALLKDGTFSLTTGSHSPEEPSLGHADISIYDQVVLAAPLQYANLSVTPRPLRPPPEIPYVNLHVTLFTSPHRLNPLVFRLSLKDRVPATILTTLPKKGIHATPPFYSISTLRSLTNPTTGEREYLYKIFSSSPISHDYLNTILSSEKPRDQTTTNPFSVDHVTWKHEKLWQSYPIESPRVTFEELIIDLEEASVPGNEGKDPMQMGRLWYTSGIEGFISTMETSSLMGKNVARLIVDGWMSKDMPLGSKAEETQIPLATEEEL